MCDRHATKVHAYIWLPNEALLLLQRFGIPLRNVLPTLLGQYSRYLHSRHDIPQGQSPYQGRCESMQVTPEVLPYAVRNLYARSVAAGLAVDPLTYGHSSSCFHFARSAPPWFETQELLERLRTRGYVGRASVESFLRKAESRRHTEMFAKLSSRMPHIAGESVDIETALDCARESELAPSVEWISQQVTAMLVRQGLPSDGVLAAAMVSWYATRAGAATLAKMGGWFDREPTTLRADMESHRKRRPVLFAPGLDGLLRMRGAVGTTQTDCGSAEPTSSTESVPISRARQSTASRLAELPTVRRVPFGGARPEAPCNVENLSTPMYTISNDASPRMRRKIDSHVISSPGCRRNGPDD